MTNWLANCAAGSATDCDDTRQDLTIAVLLLILAALIALAIWLMIRSSEGMFSVKEGKPKP